MSLIVNNNSSAFSIWSNFSANATSMKKAMGHLSTGQKGVADNPSGVGISERMRSQARNTAKARDNVENGISMLQTTDSWMQKLNDMVARMSELSIEAKDGTKGTQDISNIQTEFDQLTAEIVRVTDSAAKFNGNNLLKSSAAVTIQVGADSGQTIDVTRKDLKTLVAARVSAVGSVDATNAISELSAVIDVVSNARAVNGAQQNRLEHTRSGLLSYEDNLRASESKIRDIDMARESTDLAKFQILNQVSNAMLAQANQLPGQVMQLIG